MTKTRLAACEGTALGSPVPALPGNPVGPSTLLANFLFSSSAMESLSFLSNCHGGVLTVSTISTKTNILACAGGSGNETVSHASGPGAVGTPKPPPSCPNR